MIVVNFAHPLTPSQQDQIAALTGAAVERVIDVPTHIDETAPLTAQIAALIAATGLTTEEWQTLPLLVNLPGYAPVAAILLAHIHGLSGHFPAILRIRPVPGSTPTRYEVAEVINLTEIRSAARSDR